MRRGGVAMKKWRMFIESALQVIGMSIVVVLGITLLTGGQIHMGFSDSSGGQVVSDLPAKMIFVSIFIGSVTSSSVYSSYIPAAMCLNCRRIDVLIGMQTMKFIIAVLMAVITILLFQIGGWQFMNGDVRLELVAIAFCAMILVVSLGEVVGLIYLRFHKIGMMIMVMFFAAGGGALGVFVAMDLKKSISFNFEFANILLYAAIAAAVVWVLDIFISRRLLAGLEVR